MQRAVGDGDGGDATLTFELDGARRRPRQLGVVFLCQRFRPISVPGRGKGLQRLSPVLGGRRA